MVNDAYKRLYPFESRTLHLGPHRYHYLDEGKGEPLLMVHGNPTWSFYYRNLINAFYSSHRCVVPDHMGCGLSDKPQNYPYTLATHIDNLERLVEHLNLKELNLLVHDWGGAIGLGFAIRQPERIKRILLLNTAAFLDSQLPLSIAFCRLPILGVLAIRVFNLFARGALLRAIKKRNRLTQEVRAGYLNPYNSFFSRVAHLRFVQDIPMSPAVESYPIVKSIQSQLKRFRQNPILILWGMKDFCFNQHFLNRWREIFPEADIHEFSDAGHYVVEDAYERMVPLINKFLKKGN